MDSSLDIKTALENAISETAGLYTNGPAFSRTRKLPLNTMLHFLIAAEGGSLAKELHRAGIEATPAAVSQRRAEIPSNAFREVFERFNAATAHTDSETFRGYRVLAVDGSAVNIPFNPDADSFLRVDTHPKGGYNALHIIPLFDVLNKTFVDLTIQPESRMDEIGALIGMLKENGFQDKTLILADRGYESYNLLAHLLEKPNVAFAVRVKQHHGALREVARLPMLELDCDISFTLSTTQTNADKEKRHIYLQVPKKSKAGSKTRQARWYFPSPYPMRLRIVRFALDSGQFETIATNLPRDFSPEDIKALYHSRWEIETAFRNAKYTIGLTNLHGRCDAFCEQEVYAALIAFNFVSRISRTAVIRQPENGVYAYKVNFKMATALCREYMRTPGADGTKLLTQIARHSVPIRPGRADGRKIRPKSFTGFVYRVAA
ncbi:IS4 family transposase [Lutispora sp.]|uniref:IS4 family transposase n=1 Tax=Lutispora sp. TaxID=2828727 RepID=UPI002B1FAC3E|nr:IS4 family transposase [Lutispora sp.]MEA4960610.1 IS4 family transposase [Lutispora sp.]